ncbi:MAG TPA: helix-hairpin-helix domain-containing protein [Sedimentisphaerales bacterium]|nr:helix-hairpin-helix domain-containing protein [Sedimentisphaerales bacterium]
MTRDRRSGNEARQGRIQSFGFVICACSCVLLCSLFVVWDSWGVRQWDAIELSEAINPNEAAVGSLVRLPGIGMGRACAIVSYRDGAFREGRSAAFESCEDLQKVSGIGPKTVENIAEWLEFE